MIITDPEISATLEALQTEVRALRDLLSGAQHAPPIIPLDVAAEQYFSRKPSTVKKWVKQGHLRACSIPDGDRGHSYYFLRDQLIEDMQNNFIH